ncbi:asparagine synthase (glutamine-hydrolyzing) [uncultured Clostridium sp.]|uniref:asparagine synthase (glutamine-hydrolyzing) n=1 Tax=uncultured Clostridium sp. TaxID=59620 RepID=UPI0028E44CD0|nr:asparagine synthase (glutamine-hydrolyzing) [uncultured Clostridium sp.]
MCGISGLINKEKNILINISKSIKDMTNLIKHRGPDGEGYYVDEKVALGHRRLAIIDLNKNANQPLKNDHHILVFNGEIYNFKILKEELKDYDFKTNSDSEVILAAYERWGEECVNHFRGMWAFILYDIKKQKVFCSRDRFGIKPFYYFNNENYLAFSSEIKQFTILPEWKSIANKQRVQDFFVFGALDHTEETMFKGVNQLLPGNNLIYDLNNQELNTYSYYNLNNNINGKNDSCGSSVKFRDLMEESIREHMISDVSLGACLSGGLDSSTIVVLMDKLLKENNDYRHIDTISSCFQDKMYDEQEYIDEVNKYVSAKEHKIFPRVEELFEKLDSIIWHQDEPFGSTSIFAQWNVFKEASVNDIKVMLDGQGADEQLAGYNSFYISYFSELFFKMDFYNLQKEIDEVTKNYNYFTKEQIFERAFEIHMCSLEEKLRERVCRTDRFSKPDFDSYYKYYKKLNESMKNVQDFSLHQIYHSSLPQLLHYEDRNSMTFSIESRVPFLDHRLVEYVVSCESDKKINTGITKYILREGMRGLLPDKIRKRKDKMGFVTPEVLWIRDNKEIFRTYFESGCEFLGDLIDKNLALSWFDNQMNGTSRFDFTIWRVICLAKWREVFNIGDMI